MFFYFKIRCKNKEKVLKNCGIKVIWQMILFRICPNEALTEISNKNNLLFKPELIIISHIFFIYIKQTICPFYL